MHRIIRLPDHKSTVAVETAEKLMAHDQNRLRQELRGEAKSDEVLLFNRLLWQFQKKPLYNLQYNPQVIYSFIDPAPGTDKSDFAMTSLVHEDRRRVIVGLSRLRCNSEHDIEDKMDQVLERHFQGFAYSSRYQGALHVIYIESNGVTGRVGHFAGHIQRILGPDNTLCWHGIKSNLSSIGVLTTNHEKEQCQSLIT